MMTPSPVRQWLQDFTSNQNLYPEIQLSLNISKHKGSWSSCPPMSSSLCVPILVKDAPQLFTLETCVPSCSSLPSCLHALLSLSIFLKINNTYHFFSTPTVQAPYHFMQEFLEYLLFKVPPTTSLTYPQTFPTAIGIFLQCKSHLIKLLNSLHYYFPSGQIPSFLYSLRSPP